MRKFWLALVLVFLAASGRAHAGDTVLSEPLPSVDQPRKIVVSLNTKDDAKVNSLLYNVVNIQKFYGQDNVEIVVIGWGPGIRPLLKPDTTVRARIESLVQYDIQFVACKNTMDLVGRKVEELVDGVGWVQAGLPEIAERQLRGWAVIWP